MYHVKLISSFFITFFLIHEFRTLVTILYSHFEWRWGSSIIRFTLPNLLNGLPEWSYLSTKPPQRPGAETCFILPGGMETGWPRKVSFYLSRHRSLMAILIFLYFFFHFIGLLYFYFILFILLLIFSQPLNFFKLTIFCLIIYFWTL